VEEKVRNLAENNVSIHPKESRAPVVNMTRRPCAIYAVGIICASLLVVGIGLIVGQVFRTFMLNRLKKVNTHFHPAALYHANVIISWLLCCSGYETVCGNDACA